MSHDAPAYGGHRPPLPPSSHQSSPSSTNPQNNGLATAPHQPPAMPAAALDLLAKMNVTPEQFMQIAQMIQSGAVPFGSTAPQPQSAAPPPAWGQPAVAQPAQQTSTVPHPAPKDDVQDMNVDKEEGEVEDEDLQTSQAHDFLSTAPKGSRHSPRFTNGPGSTQLGAPSQAHPVSAGHQAPSGAHEVSRTTITGARDETSSTDIESKSAAVRSFLAAVYQNGYRYNDLVKYVPNTQLFQRIWTNMGYEVEDAANTPPEPRQPIKRAPTKPTAPQDRSAYLAKLQAAKNKKLETATAPGTSNQTVTDDSPVAKPQAVVATSAATSVSKVSQPAKRTIDNNLIRQRLERLKAERAEAEAKKKSASLIEGNKTMSSPAPFSSGSTSAASGLVADHAAPTFSPSAPNVAVGQTHIPEASASPTISRGFGLPGLFTASVPVASPTIQSQAFPQPGDANRAPSQPQHKTMSFADVRVHEDSPATQSLQTAPFTSTSSVPTKRPFGMSRSTSYDEPFVIEDSDPESDDGAKADDRAAEQQDLAKASSANVRTNNSSVPGTPQGSNEMDKKIAQLKAELAQKMAATRARQQKRQLMGNRTGDVSGQDTPQFIADESASMPLTGNGTPAVEEAADLHMNTELATAQQTVMSSKSTDAEAREADATGLSHQETSGPTDEQTVHFDALQLQGDIQGRETGVKLNGETELDNATDDQGETRERASKDNNNSVVAMDSARPDDEVEEVDDDDDDYDSIYADPGPQVSSVAVPTQAASDAPDEENDSDSAMDTSSDTSEDDYYAADRNAQYEAEPSPEPNSMAPSSFEPAVDSVDNTIELTDADQGDKAESPLDEQIDDDLASELQPSQQEQQAVSDVQATGPVKFTPYISPLRPFKDFRYHPEFHAEVPGGFKSISYNHKIDPNKMVCPFETAGGICNDKTCEFQHFKAMNLSDNELLKLMGADQIPAKQPADVQRWKAGLASLISRIRSEKQGRDVGAIAQRIAEYRREFIGDPSKTLLLD